jgi:ubiquinone/menaquinone biosynthesis C-methylase UbiE
MAAAVPEQERFESRLATVRARSASCGAEPVRRALLERLAVGRHDRVLELGVGSGRLLFAVAARAAQGFVAGVEPDATALRHARWRCGRALRSGRVVLLQGSSLDLSAFADASFDKAYGVHVTDFWDDPLPHLRELRRVLRPGGRVWLGQAAVPPALERCLAAAGFSSTQHERAGRLIWTAAH